MSDALPDDNAPLGGASVVSRQLAELTRFLVVGLSAVGTDFAVYFATTGLAPGVPVSAAKAASFVAGALVAFVLNRGFVFRSSSAASTEILPFALLYAFSLGLNTSVNAGLLALGVSRSLAWLFATGASTISNYLGMKLVVFREGRS